MRKRTRGGGHGTKPSPSKGQIINLEELQPTTATSTVTSTATTTTDNDFNIDVHDNNNPSSLSLVKQRAGLLILLLFAQSASSIVLQQYSSLITEHASIALFLTMLVGAGGNAGGQAASLVLQGLANNTITTKDTSRIVLRESMCAVYLAMCLGVVGWVRIYFFTDDMTWVDACAIALSLSIIVFLSVIVGAGLPLLMHYLSSSSSSSPSSPSSSSSPPSSSSSRHPDASPPSRPARASPLSASLSLLRRFLSPEISTFPILQVVVDVVGVIVTCVVCSLMYDSFAR